MTHAEQQRADYAAAKPSELLDEEEWRLALRQAHILKRRPLIYAGCNQHAAAEHVARACHRRIEQSCAVERPLGERRDQRETGPGQKITGDKPTGCTTTFGRGATAGVPLNDPQRGDLDCCHRPRRLCHPSAFTAARRECPLTRRPGW